MQNFLVVSYDSDEQQWFYDTVLAEDEAQASAFMCKLRPYVLAADASLGESFGVNLQVTITGTSWDASEELSECQNCGGIYPQSQLKEVEHIEERVGAGEEMPSGECPDCGAVCHLIPGAE